jgi:hypothetical protein
MKSRGENQRAHKKIAGMFEDCFRRAFVEQRLHNPLPHSDWLRFAAHLTATIVA